MTNIYDETNRSSSTLAAFFVGGLIGGTIALLYAPRSGRETREFLISEGQETADRVINSILDAQENVLDMIEEAQSRMVSVSEETRERLHRLQKIALNTIDEQKESLTKGYSEAKEAVKNRPSS